MRTIKRIPETISTNINVEKYNKYFNQMEFTGIKQDDNIYAIDQQSCRDAKNVYVDDNQRLVSRPSLQAAEMPDSPVNYTQGTTTNVTKAVDSSVVPITYRLIDIKDFDRCKLYISQSVQYGTFTIYATLNNESDYEGLANGGIANFVLPLSGMGNITAYHISAVNHYIICFNNQDAKVLDTNALYKGWQKLTDFAEIPVVKRISTSTTEYDTYNQFIPNIYKEEYLWNNESQPVLPATETGKVTLDQNIDLGSIDIEDPTLNDAYAELRLLRPYNYSLNDISDYIVSVAVNADLNMPIVCMATDRYVKVSYNGNSFEKIMYPDYGNSSKFKNIAEISRDGHFFFFVTSDGVYRLNLTNKLWSEVFRFWNDTQTGYTSISGSVNFGYANAVSCFLSEDTFCFVLDGKLYFKGNGLYAGTDYTKDYMDTSSPTYYSISSISTVYDQRQESYTIGSLFSPCYKTHRKYTINMGIHTFNNIQSAHILITTSKGEGWTFESNIIYICGGNLSSLTNYSVYNNRMYTDVIALVHDTHTGTTNYTYWSGTVDPVGAQAGDFWVPYGHPYIGYYDGITWDSVNFETSSECNVVYGPMIFTNYELTDDPRYLVGTILTNSGGYSGLSHPPAYFGTLVLRSAFTDTPNTYVLNYISQLSNESIPVSPVYEDNYNLPIPITSNAYYIDYKDAEASDLGGEGIYILNQGSVPLPDNIKLDETNKYKNVFTENGYLFIYASLYTDPNSYYLWTNYWLDNNNFVITYTYGNITANKMYKEVPKVSYADTELYLAFDNLLQITYNGDYNSNTPFYLPKINNQSFVENITGLINISTKEVAIFFENDIKICAKMVDENLTQGFRYDYYNTKLSTGIRLGDSVINTLEGNYTIFPTLRGLAVMNYQAFMATSDQVLTYLSDDIKEIWSDFFGRSLTSGKMIRIIQWRDRLFITNNTTECLIYDFTRQAWWKWELHKNSLVALSNQFYLYIITNVGTTLDTLFVFKPEAKNYYDDSERGDFSHPIQWFYLSQPLHFNSPNYYKNIKQLVFQLSDSDGTDGKISKTMDTQVRLFRKRVTTREPETISFKIQELRTFVKRFNYWKINELQWGISNDDTTSTPFRLELNGISVKYDLGEEVR